MIPAGLRSLTGGEIVLYYFSKFYLSKPKRKAHDREVLTNYVGELIQNDSSEH